MVLAGPRNGANERTLEAGPKCRSVKRYIYSASRDTDRIVSTVRLQKFLASGGVAARRKSEVLITQGRVMVNGRVVKELGSKVDPARDRITVDGDAVVSLEHFYVIFNKPKGCITALTDDRDRPVVMDYLPNLPIPVKPVGRLDFYTEGLLLLTNDGELAARLLSKAYHVPKTYHAKIRGTITPQDLERLRTGVRLDDGSMTMPAEVAELPAESRHSWIALTIYEGKQRQIHRMFEALGYEVQKLQRVAFASLTFHGLRVGDARELTQLELNALRDVVELDHSAGARGAWRVEREDTDISRRARNKQRDEREMARIENEAGRERNEAQRAVTGSAADNDGDFDDDDNDDLDDRYIAQGDNSDEGDDDDGETHDGANYGPSAAPGAARSRQLRKWLCYY